MFTGLRAATCLPELNCETTALPCAMTAAGVGLSICVGGPAEAPMYVK